MTTRFEVNLATPVDDAGLRALLAATPMDGSIALAFAREPSYFAAAEIDGAIRQVGVVRDRASGRIVGMGSRAIAPRYINGQPTPVGYLSALRIAQEFRGSAGLLARTFRLLREMHADHRAPFYLTTIAAENEPAAQLLCSGRAGLPVYHPSGAYHTLALATHAGSSQRTASDPRLTIRPAEFTDRDQIVRFLNEHGPARQFFPVYETSDLFSESGRLKGLQPADVLLAIREGQLAGTLAAWDQRGYKQTIVHSYHGWLRSLRPFYNAFAAIRRRPALPAPGAAIDARVAAIPVIRHDDPEVFRSLLAASLERLAGQGGPLLLVGLHEHDPLLPVVRSFAGREFLTNLFLVHWPDDPPDLPALSLRTPYLELGCL